MVEDFETIKIWQAGTIALPGFANATNKFENGAEIKLDYCIPKQWSKKRTETTGVESEIDVHPDTGPAGAFVEIQIIIDRKTTSPTFLKHLMRWYATQNTDSDFTRGFLGLENSDNPELNLVPSATLGYKLVYFQQINPSDHKARQMYQIVLQLGGSALNMPVFT